jgi:hypothetical protein
MYRIRWRKLVSVRLLDECAKANSSLQSDILNAMADVESTLHNEPEFVGESREPGKRFVIVDPLSVVYKVDHRNRTVVIVDGWVHTARR